MSSTEPHPESYLEARCVQDRALIPGSKVDTETGDTFERRKSISSDLRLGIPNAKPPTPLRGQSLEDLFPGARVVLSSSPSLKKPVLVTRGEFRLASENLIGITQSPAETSFGFTSDLLSFRCIYDPWSDKLILSNDGTKPLAILQYDDLNFNGKVISLEPRGHGKLGPGLWTIYAQQISKDVLGELAIMGRRYSWETTKVLRAESTDRTIENPLGVLEPAHRLSITDTLVLRGSKSTEPTMDAASEGYNIANTRNIVSKKAAALIFCGYHSRLAQTVAVKVLKGRDDLTNARIISIAKSWERERVYLQRINHDSIIQLLGSDARFFSLYLSYYPFKDLAAWEKDYYFTGTASDATKVLFKIGSALDYLHTQSILHNDIKPGNILYDQEHGPVLIDFGLASSVDSVACCGGTAWYIPPEYMFKGQRGPEGDIFALGVTVLYLLRKIKLPEVSPSKWAIRNVRWLGADREAMQRWLKEVHSFEDELGSTEDEAIVKRMLAVNPAERISARVISDLSPYKKSS